MFAEHHRHLRPGHPRGPGQRAAGARGRRRRSGRADRGWSQRLPGRSGARGARRSALRGLARREAIRERLATGGLLAVRERSWGRSLAQLADGYAAGDRTRAGRLRRAEVRSVPPDQAALAARAAHACAPRPDRAGCGSPTSRCSTASAAAASAPTSRPRPSSPLARARSSTTSSCPGASTARGDPHSAQRHDAAVAAAGGLERLPDAARRRRSCMRPCARSSRTWCCSTTPTGRRGSRAARAHEIGAAVIAVHHSSAALHAAGLPGPHGVYTHGAAALVPARVSEVDAVMSVVDTDIDASRPVHPALRLGLDPAFRPRPGIVRRRSRPLRRPALAREGAARAAVRRPPPRASRGRSCCSAPVRRATPCTSARASSGSASASRFAPYLHDRDELARAYAGASCVVLPGAHETFGLAALEAAACGASVVTADSTPVGAQLLDGFVETFAPATPPDLLRAIERARRRRPDPRSCGRATRWPLAHRAGTAALVAARARRPRDVRCRTSMSGRLAVALHDVEPRSFARAREIRDWLLSAESIASTLLVIPAADLHPIGARAPALAAWLRGRVACGDAVAQHGLGAQGHRVRPGRAACSRAGRAAHAAEFPGLAARGRRPPGAHRAAACCARSSSIRAGSSRPGTPTRARCGTYCANLRVVRGPPLRFARDPAETSAHARSASGARPRSSGPLAAAGPRRRASAGRVMRVDIHPADFDRQARRDARGAARARARGRSAVTYDELLAEARAPIRAPAGRGRAAPARQLARGSAPQRRRPATRSPVRRPRATATSGTGTRAFTRSPGAISIPPARAPSCAR